MSFRQNGFVLTALTILVSMAVPARCAIVYVNAACDGVHNGSSWSSAYQTVGGGLATAESGDEIWVAAGTYVEQVPLKPGVGVYGGFAGQETLRDERNSSTNVTILDGGNMGSVVSALLGCGSDTVVDGFTIRGGRAATGTAKNGGGVCCISSSPTISNNIITGNVALGLGGAIYCNGGAPRILENLITDNTATTTGSGVIYGGGLCFIGSSATVTRNIIERNRVTAATGCGGGVFCDAQSAISLSGNTIVGNSASTGGGIYCSSSTATIANNCIRTNSASVSALSQGGGIYCQASPLIANNTICENNAPAGGGIYCSGQAAPTLANNIVAFNSSGILKNVLQTPQVRANCVYGNTSYNYSGWDTQAGPEGNISVNPKFAGLANGDIHIQTGSPCRNAGDNGQVQTGWTDIGNEKRVQEALVDIGADEYPEPQAAASSIAQARQAESGREVNISEAVVSAAFSDFFYIEAVDRSCGIRVEQPGHGVVAGSRVNVHGVMRTNTDGERCIEVTAP